MKKIISLLLAAVTLVCSTYITVLADENKTVTTIKGEAAVYNTAENNSFDILENEIQGRYFVEFSILLRDFNTVRTISLSGTEFIKFDKDGTISVFGSECGTKSDCNQWLDIYISAEPGTGNYCVNINDEKLRGTNSKIVPLQKAVLLCSESSGKESSTWIGKPAAESLEEPLLPAPSKTYIKRFEQTQGGAPDYIRETVDDPTGAGKGDVERLSLNNKKWMEGRSAGVSLSAGVYEIGADVYFNDFNSVTNSFAVRTDGSKWVELCTFKHDTKSILIGSSNSTDEIYSGYNVNEWYGVRIVLDLNNGIYTVFIYDDNGNFLGSKTAELDGSSVTTLSVYVGSPKISGVRTSEIYLHDYYYEKVPDGGILETAPHNKSVNVLPDGVIYIQSVNTINPESLAQAAASVPADITLCAPDTVKAELGGLDKNTEYSFQMTGLRDVSGTELNVSLSFMTGNGIKYGNLKLEENESVSRAYIEHYGEMYQDGAKLYIASYKSADNEMTGYAAADISEQSAEIAHDGDCYTRAYLWDGDMKPLTPSVGKAAEYADAEPCELSVVKDYNTNIVTIQGTAAHIAAIMIMDENGNIIALDEAAASANGYFKTELYTEFTGKVKLLVNTGDGKREIPYEFFSAEQADEIIRKFASENADYDKLITSYWELFGFNLQEYNSVPKDKVAELMRGKEYNNFSDVTANYNYAVATAGFCTGDSGRIKALINKWDYKFKDSATYEYYKTLDEKTLDKIYENMALRTDYKDMDDAVKEFEIQTVLSAVECAQINNEVAAALRANGEYLGISFSDYDRISDTGKVTGKMRGKKYLSVTELKQDFERLVREALTVPVSGGTGGGFSGGTRLPDKKTAVPDASVIENMYKGADNFTDIKEAPWAEECIIYLYNKKIINGKSENLFKPMDKITRAEFVKIITLAFNKETKDGEISFGDVESGAWYEPYIITAYLNGWITGKSAEIFGVNDNITREDAAVILYRIANDLNIALEKEKSVFFYDSDSVSDYARDAVTALAECGIINGTDSNLFLPENTATRAEAAKMIYSLLTVSGV